MKVVVNRDYGGFSISREAAEHMAAAGSERAKRELAQGDGFYGHGYVEGMSGDYERDDPLLVAAVETLGKAADGELASLEVVEIPDGVDWQIEEYDGKEWVAPRSIGPGE